MIGYIIGAILGILVFLWQYIKPVSAGFRFLLPIFTVAFIWGIYYARLGYLNIIAVPVGELILCFIVAFCFPYGANSALNEYMAINGRNYFSELKDEDLIGPIKAPGFRQSYDRIMGGILTQIVKTQDDFQKISNLLYSKNFYPISTHTKAEIIEHIHFAIDDTAKDSPNGMAIRINTEKNIELIFNTYVAVMSIHEEATRNIEKLRAGLEEVE